MTPSDPRRSVILVSGGMDSCVVAAMMRHAGFELNFLHTNYGQRTERRELDSFHALADYFAVERRLVVDIRHLALIGGSSLTDMRIDVAAANLESRDVPTSYVPFRNANILTIATSWAETIGAGAIAIGAVEEDSSGYPDCRVVFYDAFQKVVELGTHPDTRITIMTPVIAMSKEEIVRTGLELDVPFHLTWSCYQSDDPACGICDSCALRLRGFERAGAVDPLPYRVAP